MSDYRWKEGDPRLVAGTFLTAMNCERYAKAMSARCDDASDVYLSDGNASASLCNDGVFNGFDVTVTVEREDGSTYRMGWTVWVEEIDGARYLYGEC